MTLLHVQDRGRIGQHLESRLAEFIFLGSVSHKVVRHAPTAVLLVPAVGKLATDATVGATNSATQHIHP